MAAPGPSRHAYIKCSVEKQKGGVMGRYDDNVYDNYMKSLHHFCTSDY